MVLELSQMSMVPKEWVKKFNQILLTLRNKILTDMRLVEEVTIEFYTKGLPVTIAMFLKRVKLTTLAVVFDETVLIEKKRNNLVANMENECDNPSTSKKCTEQSDKNIPENKEASSFDLDSLQMVIKKLADEVIDIKKNNNEQN